MWVDRRTFSTESFRHQLGLCTRLITYCTMLGLFTTVVLFLRLRRTSLWNTWELSLEWQTQRSIMSLSFYTCVQGHVGNCKWDCWVNVSNMLKNLRPLIMGALLDLLKCPSLWTNEDGISRSSSIFSWGNTPELFILQASVITNSLAFNE